MLIFPSFFNAAAGGYEIEQSLRFDGSSRLTRTHSCSQTRTFSFWNKYAFDNSNRYLYFHGDGSNYIGTRSGGSPTFNSWQTLNQGSSFTQIYRNGVKFRDPAAWYHFVFKCTSSNVILYINGEEWGSSGGANVALSSKLFEIGSRGNAEFFTGYQAEWHFVDGQALDPTDFGEFDNNGVWRPVKPAFTEASRYSTPGYEAIFDGNTSNGVVIGNSYVTVASGLNITAASTIGFNDNGGSQLKSMRINGTTEFTVTGGSGWQDFNFTGTINTIELKYNGSTLYTGIRVDGTTLVDNYGDYGQNGFYLKFDPSATNGIGHDHSGNGNNFSPSGFTTSGTGTDVMSDTPTTNYPTGNPLASNNPSSVSEGNLKFVGDPANIAANGMHTTMGMSSGKWYFEVDINVGGGARTVGILPADAFAKSGKTTTTNYDTYYNDGALSYSGFSQKIEGHGASVTINTYGDTWTTNDVIGVAFDADNGKLFFAKNNTWQESGDPAAGTNAAFTGISGTYVAHAGGAQGFTATFNFGQRAFAYTPPTGFKALNTSNLPAPTVKDGSKNFDTLTWTGDSSGATRTFSGLAFQPDLVWAKGRNQAISHQLTDAVRGAGATSLRSDDTRVEGADGTSSGYLSAFTSDGFTSTSSSTNVYYNTNTYTYVAWNWLASNTSGSSNTAGSITSTVSANPSAGFSIVTYAGSGTGGDSIGHGLGVPPKMIIAKSRGGGPYPTASWAVYHESIGASKSLALDTTAAAAGPYSNPGTVWYNTTPTSTVFYVGNLNETNGSNNYVAYCFAEVEGYSKFGSYTGNGSTDGPFVSLPFAPAMIIIKKSNAAANWVLMDKERYAYNPRTQVLYPSDSSPEVSLSGVADIDFLSNGFKLRRSWDNINASGGTYVFAAFASSPFGGSGVSPATAR